MTPFKKALLLPLFSFLVVFVILSPYLVGGKIVRGDGSDVVIPYFTFLKEAFQNGDSPFWNPHNAAGFPTFVSNSHPLFPLHILLLIFSPLTTHNIGLFIILGLALLFTILFIRELGAPYWGALIAGLSFMISQIVYENNVLTAFVVFFQAFFFWGLVKFSKSESRKQSLLYGFFLVLAIALGWFSGGASYQFVTYSIIGGLIFALFFAYHSGKKLRTIAWQLVVICGIGTAIGLFQLIPAFTINHFSNRAGGFSVADATTEPIVFSDLLLFLNPFLARSSESFLYMGLIPLLLFLASFFVRAPHLRFFRWTFFVAFLIGFNHSPLLWLIQKIPLLNSFRYPSRYMIVGSFAGATVAGLALYPLLLKFKSKLSGIADGSRKNFIAIGLVVLVSLTAVDYALAFWNKFLPVSVDASLLFNSQSSQALKKFAGDGRILSVLPENGLSVFYWSRTGQAPPEDIRSLTLDEMATLKPNNNLWYSLESIEYLDSLLPNYMGRYLSLLGGRQLGDYGEEKLHKYNVAEVRKVQLLKQRQGLLDFLGIKYLLSNFNLNDVGFGFPVAGNFSLAELQSGGVGLPFTIFKNPGAKPIAYFDSVTQFVGDGETAYQKFKGNNFQGVFVECADCLSTKIDPNAAIAIQRQNNGRLEISTMSSSRQFLISSQSFLPGWEAFIDNQPTMLYRVNAVFAGLFVPTGKHEITLKFSYPGLFRGALTK